jgi:hypothetical protein
MAATDIVITGLGAFTVASVDVVIGGLDCGTFTLSGSTVTVPIDSNPLLSGDYLQSIDVGPWDRTTYGDATTELTVQLSSGARARVYVPVTVGNSYASLGQTLRANAENQIKSPSGGGIGKKRHVYSYAMLLAGAQGISVGTNWGALLPAPLKTKGGVTLPANVLYYGVVEDTLQDTDSFDGMVCWAITRPYPCVITGTASFVEVKEH